jgi:hypothetical protein
MFFSTFSSIRHSVVRCSIIFSFSFFTFSRLLFSHLRVSRFFFFLNCFWWNRSPYYLYFPLPPLREQPTAKCHPRWQPISGQQSTVGWGDCWIWTQDCSFTIWCRYQWATKSLPMSHHVATNEPPSCYQWATKSLPMSHHVATNELIKFLQLSMNCSRQHQNCASSLSHVFPSVTLLHYLHY